MSFSRLRHSGHWPTLLTAFLYFDVSFMVWTMLGPLGAQIGSALHLTPGEKGLLVALPILSGAVFRIFLGLMVDSIGAKRTGIIAQLFVIAGISVAWRFGLPHFGAALALGLVLGVAGASFAVALPQAGRWYPPGLQGLVMGLAGAGNIGVVLDALIAPRLAAHGGPQVVFGWALIPLAATLALYGVFSKEPPAPVRRKTLADYAALLRERDSHWFCLLYLVSFGGFSGLASSLVIIFTTDYKLTPVHAGQWAALCTFIGSVVRPVGGAIADRLGGIRALHFLYVVAAAALVGAAAAHSLAVCAGSFMVAGASFGMANGAVFQLLPQRFSRDLGAMTGLVGAAGGVGGFALASALGLFKGWTGSYFGGLIGFSGLCLLALVGLAVVKTRWRSTWGALEGVRI